MALDAGLPIDRRMARRRASGGLPPHLGRGRLRHGRWSTHAAAAWALDPLQTANVRLGGRIVLYSAIGVYVDVKVRVSPPALLRDVTRSIRDTKPVARSIVVRVCDVDFIARSIASSMGGRG